MLSGARKFGDPVRLLSDAITYASNAASIIIRTPKDEQVLIVGMLYTGSHGLLTKVTSFTHMNYDRILKSGTDSKAVMLSHMASSGQRITVTGADGWQGAGPFMGDGQSFLNVLNMHLDRYMDSGIHDDTREAALARAVDYCRGLKADLGLAGIVCGGENGGNIQIDVTDLSSGSDVLEHVTLYGISLGSRTNAPLHCIEHNTPYWLGQTVALTTTAANVSRADDLAWPAKQSDIAMHIALGATIVKSGALDNASLEDIDVRQPDGTPDPAQNYGGREALAMLAGGNGAPLPRYFRKPYRNGDLIGLDAYGAGSGTSTLYTTHVLLSKVSEIGDCLI